MKFARVSVLHARLLPGWAFLIAMGLGACSPTDEGPENASAGDAIVDMGPSPGTDTGGERPAVFDADVAEDAAMDGSLMAPDSSPGPGAVQPEGTHCFDGRLVVDPVEGGFEVSGARYRLYYEGERAEAEEAGRLLEAAWPGFVSYFHGTPTLTADEGLRVKVYADYPRFVDGMAEDGVQAPGPGAGGYFDPGGGTAYLYLQPTVYYTNVLTIHEAAHQFHRRGQSEWRDLPLWYVEGVAEFISRHDWDGQCVRLGVRPLLSQEDFPARALAEIDANGLDLAAIVSGLDDASRPIFWAIFGFFEEGMEGALAPGFSAFRAALDGGTGEAHQDVFEREVGPLNDFEEPLLDWLRTAQLAMRPVFTEWTHLRPDAVWGHGANFSFAVFRAPLSTLSAAVRTGPSPWTMGFIIEYLDNQNYTGMVVSQEGAVSTFEMREGRAVWWDQGRASLNPMAERVSIAVQRRDDGLATVQFGETGFEFPVTMPPIMGLAINNSDVRFEALDWTLRDD